MECLDMHMQRDGASYMFSSRRLVVFIDIAGELVPDGWRLVIKSRWLKFNLSLFWYMVRHGN
jgi:hypothetical protein